ncbi:MAG: HAD family hydrolase [Lachnospiraceae bacterium]|nr:HAD family hydrolase [Lachnospiraceae bacterium]
MSKQGIIFDMDGTLWDSAEGVAKSWTEVVAEKYTDQRVITVDEIHGVMGKTMDVIARLLFPELDKEQSEELLDHCCKQENAYLREHGGILYPDLEEIMQTLQKKYHLYIVSNCQSGYIEAFLDHYKLGHYFEDIECYGNTGEKKAGNIRAVVARNALTDAVYVGDIQGDYDASCEAGVRFIHAAYGFGTIDRKVPAIGQLSDLPEVIDGVFAE